MKHELYSKPAFSSPWERDKEQKNGLPVVYARDEKHAQQLRGIMKRKKVRFVVEPEKFRF